MSRRIFRLLLSLTIAATCGWAQNAGWPVNGGGTDNIRYSRLKQINRDNVSQLQVAWTYDSMDSFNGSEAQSNPLIIDGVLYSTTASGRVVALNAETGRELWTFNPAEPGAARTRIRNRGVTIHENRLFF